MKYFKFQILFFIIGYNFIINSLATAGIPLEKQITPEEAKARYQEMKYQQEKFARELWEARQKKEEELKKKKQPPEIPQPSMPISPEIEKKLPHIPDKDEKDIELKKEEGEVVGQKVEEEISKPIPPSPEEIKRGKVPGVTPIIPEKEEVKTEKVEKQRKVVQEPDEFGKKLSYILVIIVMLATIGLLIKGILKGKSKDEKKG